MATPTNEPDLWVDEFPVPSFDGHKYNRGWALVLAAPELTGATRLAASACSRIGAGLVTVLASSRADVYRSSLPADLMVRERLDEPYPRATAMLAGPGGLPDRWTDAVALLEDSTPIVVDADALVELAVFTTKPRPLVITPHEGEFSRALPDLSGSRVDRCLEAAELTESVVLLKGAETLIGAPDGRLVVNRNASPYLAKAGSGDVLAGFVTGLLAQGMEPFAAACAAVWIHGEAARRVGPGLIPTDLIEQLPSILRDLLG